MAISKQDYKILQKCKGITHKIANNIINYFSNHIKVVSNLTTSQNEKSDLVFDTLLKLGFSSIVINNFLLRNINWDLEVEEIIALAIKEIKYGY